MSKESKIMYFAVPLITLAMSVNCFAYSDVTNKHWAYDKIETLSGMGFFSDITQEEFYPDTEITREEFFTIMIKGVYGEQVNVSSLPFQDENYIPKNILPYVSKAYEEGVLSGNKINGSLYMDGKKSITREEAASTLSRMLKLTSTEDLNYLDKDDISPYAYEAVSGLKSINIMGGYENNMFNPKDNITRAESASILYTLKENYSASENNVTTYAGNGNLGMIDDNSQISEFCLPTGIASDNNGNLYVMDTYNNLIRCISTKGDVKTISGNGNSRDLYGFGIGAFKDGKNADSYFNMPTFAAVNSKGELIVSDSENNMIRLVGKENTTTLSGNKQSGYVNGSSTNSRFNSPQGIAIGKDGKIYVADTLNHCIRTVDEKGNTALYAGTPKENGFLDGVAKEAMFNEPTGLAIATDGTLYVSDTGNQRIRKIDKNGIVTTLAGGGTDTLRETEYIYGEYFDGKGESAKFNFPMGIDIINDKYIVVADSKNHAVRLVDLNGTTTTIAGNTDSGSTDGKAFSATFNNPTDVVYMDKKIYITDQQNNMIRVLEFDVEVLK